MISEYCESNILSSLWELLRQFLSGGTESWFFPVYCLFCLKKQILIFLFDSYHCATLWLVWGFIALKYFQKIADICYFTIKNITNTHLWNFCFNFTSKCFLSCNGIPSEFKKYFSILGQYYNIVPNLINMGQVLAVP